MELNIQETNVYVEYKRKIDEIWQDQVDAGPTFGRANLREVFGAFKSLKEKIEKDPELSQEYKNELLGIIINKMGLAKDREEEVLKAERDFSREQVQALNEASERYKKMSLSERSIYSPLYSRLFEFGYYIFIDKECADKLFIGENNYEGIKESLTMKYPIISEDLSEVFEKVEDGLTPKIGNE